jgi:hypothetical protein
MTNTELAKGYAAIFPVHILFNQGNATLLGGTQRKPPAGGSCFAFVPVQDDFKKVQDDSIVAVIRVKHIKSKV